jgi:signal transduction histidine kinase
MLNIISDLVEISRIEAGETTLRIRKTNVNKMLHDLHLFFLPQGNKKNIFIDYHCDLKDEESILETDSTKLNQILTNLLKNAVKFTKEGSIAFGYKKKESGLEFYVSDTGTGIPPEQKNLIFERFRQADHGLTRQYEGIGLGLTISKAYVEQLGGSIRLESELGKGSTFIFELPYQYQAKD